MKIRQLVFFVAFVLGTASISALISDARQEQPIAGERRGDRCFNGRYWKDCGVPDVQPLAIRPPASAWRAESCFTNECIADILNRLPGERAAEAKLTTWKNTTYVWFRE